MLKFYLAGKYDDRVKLNGYIQQLQLNGYEVTHNWTIVDPTLVNDETRSELDIEGVTNADWVIFMMTDPEYVYRGTFTELGAALALKKKIIIVNPNPKAYCTTNIFYKDRRVAHRVNTWEEAKQILESI